MSKVMDEIHIGHIVILRLDELPAVRYTRFIIDGKTYTPVPILDAENCIAFESTDSFLSKTVAFL